LFSRNNLKIIIIKNKVNMTKEWGILSAMPGAVTFQY